MKIYHILYNSSEKTRSGSVGFGVRAVTKGTPDDLVRSIESAGLFTYAKGDCRMPRADELEDNGDLIKNVPSTYFYRKLEYGSNGDKVWVIGRAIPVGFDYPYYENYEAARMGNYVVDCYAFDEVPNSNVIGILYDSEKNNTTHFIPISPAPSKANEEMKRLSLGSMEDFPTDDESFDYKPPLVLNNNAVHLLFAFLRAKKNNKALIVKTKWQDSNKYAADLLNLLPCELKKSLSLITNYSEDGIMDGFNVFFINEFYSSEIFDSIADFVDYTQDVVPITTTESKLYYKHIESNLLNNDYSAIHNIISWITSKEYSLSVGLSTASSVLYYQYCNAFDSFVFSEIEKNDELRAVLPKLFGICPERKSDFAQRIENDYFRKCVNSTDALNAILRFNLFNSISNIEDLKKKYCGKFTDMALSSADSFWMFIAYSGKCSVFDFLDREKLSNSDKIEFVFDSNALKSNKISCGQWLENYKKVLSPHFISNKTAIIEYALKSNIESIYVSNLFESLYTGENINSLVSLIKSKNIDSAKLWPYLKAFMDNTSQTIDFISEFGRDYGNDSSYAEYFRYQLCNDNRTYSDVSKAFSKLDEYKRIISSNEGLKNNLASILDSRTGVYSHIYDSIVVELKIQNNGEDYYTKINDCVIKLFEHSGAKNLQKWSLLCKAIYSKVDSLTPTEKRNLSEFLIEHKKLNCSLRKALISVELNVCIERLNKQDVKFECKEEKALLKESVKFAKDSCGKDSFDFYYNILKESKSKITRGKQYLLAYTYEVLGYPIGEIIDSIDEKFPSFSEEFRISEDDFLKKFFGAKYSLYKRKHWFSGLFKKLMKLFAKKEVDPILEDSSSKVNTQTKRKEKDEDYQPHSRKNNCDDFNGKHDSINNTVGNQSATLKQNNCNNELKEEKIAPSVALESKNIIDEVRNSSLVPISDNTNKMNMNSLEYSENKIISEEKPSVSECTDTHDLEEDNKPSKDDK